MILRLEVPATNPSLRGGTVKEWHKSEGDEFAFGEEVCTIAFDDFAALRRTARATLLSGRKSKNLKSKLEAREGKVFLKVVLSSAEPGTMGKIIRHPGDRFAVGDTLAVVSTAAGDGEIPEEWDESPPLRVVANTSTEGDH